ncbi:MAG: RDD domain-containing protein [Nitrospira sp.]|nr:RDD family protein [Nitrospira sp.]ULA59311.1 MAG: RDD domain-containing protein [Nitrospira sp.]
MRLFSAGFRGFYSGDDNKGKGKKCAESGCEKIATLFVQVKEICYSVEELGRFPVAEEAIGRGPVELGVYPKAQVLNRFIAKMIDLLIVAAVSKLVPPIGVLAGLAYILLADGFGGGRSVGKRLIGLQTIVPRTRDPAGFRESIIRNLPCGLAQLAFEIPYVGWIGWGAVLSLEGLLVIGNEQGRRLGDEIAKTQVLESGQLDVSD